MKRALRALDRILRGEATRLPELQRGSIDIPAGSILTSIIVLAMIYGAFMGLSAVITRWNSPDRYMGWQQMGASIVKVPMLFLLTLLITFPSLYVFNALVGSRLFIGAMLKLLVAAMAVMLMVLASFGPIVGFFAASTTSYPFMKLLNVLVFGIAGFLGLAYLMQTLHRLTIAQEIAPPPSLDTQPPPDVPAPPTLPPPRHRGALDRMTDQAPARNVKVIFRIWVIVFALVGAQMSWVLRPFIGDPSKDFQFFRGRDSNFFEGVSHSVQHLLWGEPSRGTPPPTDPSQDGSARRRSDRTQ
jgi:hypothetical protein